MKNKRHLIPLVAGGVLLAGLSSIILFWQDDKKVSGPSELKQPDFSDSSYAELPKKEVYTINRTPFNVIDAYQPLSAELSDVKVMKGTRLGQKNSEFIRFTFGGASFDLDHIVPASVRLGKRGDALVIEDEGSFQLTMYKVSSEATMELIGEKKNTVLYSKYQSIAEEYIEECNKKALYDKIDVYMDADDGGILTYTPMVDFIKENKLEKELSIYSYSAYKAILNKCFEVPEDYQYAGGTERQANTFARTGLYKVFNDLDDLGHEVYYLYYSEQGIFACKLYYESNKSLMADDVRYTLDRNLADKLAPAHTDHDISTLGNTDADYVEIPEQLSSIKIENFTSEEIKSKETLIDTINGRIYIRKK